MTKLNAFVGILTLALVVFASKNTSAGFDYGQSGLAGVISGAASAGGLGKEIESDRLYEMHCVCVREGGEPDESVDDCECTTGGVHVKGILCGGSGVDSEESMYD